MPMLTCVLLSPSQRLLVQVSAVILVEKPLNLAYDHFEYAFMPDVAKRRYRIDVFIDTERMEPHHGQWIQFEANVDEDDLPDPVLCGDQYCECVLRTQLGLF